MGAQASEKQIQQLIDELGAQKAQERAETSYPGKCVLPDFKSQDSRCKTRATVYPHPQKQS